MIQALLANFINGKISRRELSHRLLGMGFGMATVESILDNVTPAHAQEAESFRAEPFSAQTPYEQWTSKEGIPVYTGYAIPNVRSLELKPWARLGANAAIIDLTGSEGTDGAFLFQLQPNAETKPQRYMFEESIFILDGEGETTVWQQGGPKQSFRWKKGAMFSPPLNVWRQHVNRGPQPVKLISFHDMPLMMDVMHNANFLFNNPFVFGDRYDGQKDYFNFDNSKLRPEGTAAMFAKGEEGAGRIADTGLIPDVNALELRTAKSRGLHNKGIEMVFSGNTMQTHISEFATGSYKRAHRHGPGSQILILGGQGYSLMWTDLPHYSEAPKHTRIDWKEGAMFVPPDRWFHQHFNGGADPAKYMATTWIGGKYFAKSLGGGGRTHRMNNVSIRQGGNMVDYPDEDPIVRSMFVEELKKHGLKLQMENTTEGGDH